MRKIVFTLAATAFFAGILLTSCNSPSRNNENDNVQDTQSDLNMRQDSDTEFQQFKTDYQNQIRANERKIAELRASTVDVSQENKVSYEENLAELETRNNDLKIELAEYKEGDNDQWQTFKTEFKREMDELGKEFSDLTDNNKQSAR